MIICCIFLLLLHLYQYIVKHLLTVPLGKSMFCGPKTGFVSLPRETLHSRAQNILFTGVGHSQ